MTFAFESPGTALPFDDIIDVRSPSEFAEDHIQGAINLPVLSDEERAIVGTIYVQDSPFKARKLGAALVSRNIARHLEGPLANKPKSWQPLVYCWRGGQRSGSFASVLRQIGWQAEVVEGGYRAYRRCVKKLLYEQAFPARVVLLSGNTGTAKTAILQNLAALGMQTIDLEALACHRGSLFGGTPVGQPSQKAFETALAADTSRLCSDLPVVVEAESNKIGARIIPPALWEAMKAAPRIEVTAPLDARAQFTLQAYAEISEDRDGLAAILQGLRPYHPKERIDEWLEFAQGGDFVALARALMADHYDPRYRKSRARHQSRGSLMGEIAMDALTPDDISEAARQVRALLG